jgi:hypothetical protein
MLMKFLHKIRVFMSSEAFFYTVMVLFFLSSLWIALSGRYPMAFDENYHYGIIKAYSHQLSPFFSHPPLHSEALGDITRFPSYLFHYLLSFLYRLLSLFTNSDSVKIIVLRIINIMLLGSSLFVFRRIFKKLKVGSGVSNIALLFFVLTPVVPFLAAQINYDNLLIPLTAWALLLLLTVIERLKAGKLDVRLSIGLLTLCLFTSLVKYTFLPIFAVIGVAGIYVMVHERKRQKLQIWKQLKSSFKMLGLSSKLMLVVGLVLGLGLFVERYGVNIVKYHSPVPDCQQVLSEKSCLQYGPWARDYYLVHSKTGPPSWNALRYTGHWSAQNMHELFFAIDQNYYEQSPLPLPYYAAWIFGGAGLLLIILNWKKLRQLPHFNLATGIILFYAAALWADNYHRFLTVNWPVAIHGRYLLPLLPLVYVLVAYAFKVSLNSSKPASYFKIPLATVAIFCMLQGGTVTYIVRSADSWCWHNEAVVSINSSARRVLDKIVLH